MGLCAHTLIYTGKHNSQLLAQKASAACESAVPTPCSKVIIQCSDASFDVTRSNQDSSP